jgi:NADP-dependent 3-hydroxy acid dehydrogenase YdfG
MRHEAAQRVQPRQEALAPDEVAELFVWIASSPAHLVLNEVTITPLAEKGWP